MARRSRTAFMVLFVFLVVLSASLLHLVLKLQDPHKAPPKLKPEYPAGVPDKFDPDGNVQHFPGNTIISHLSNSSELYSSLLVLYERLKKSPHSHLYTLLPPSSWHMTIFEGVTDKVRKPSYWPSNLPSDASIEECTELYLRELSTFDLRTPLPYHLTVTELKPIKGSISLHIEPHTTDNIALRGLRDRLAERLKIRGRNYNHYSFHIAVAYPLRFLTEDQDAELKALIMDHFKDMPKEFELGAPEFCRFEDMFAYERLMYLKNQES